MSDVITLLIAAGNPLVRAGLRQFLNGTSPISLIGETDRSAEILTLTQQLQPAVVLLDHAFGEVLEQICECPSPCAVIVLVDACHPAEIKHALARGARGVITKDIEGEELNWIVTQAARKRRMLSLIIQETLIAQWLAKDVGMLTDKLLDLEPLTGRERAVFELVVQGLSNQQIAEQLSLSLSTVKSHVSNLQDKLEVDNRAAVVRLAMGGRPVDGQDETA